MNKGTIVFLAVNASYSHTNLAGWYLRAYTETAGWTWQEVEVVQTDSLSAVLRRVLRLNPDIIATSFYLFNHHFLLSFLSRYKALKPCCLVIGGGPEFLGNNFCFLERHREIDVVIRGEGESAFAAWLACHDQPQKWKKIRGLCAFVGGQYVDNGKAEIVKNLDEIPSPYECGLISRGFNPGRAGIIADMQPETGSALAEKIVAGVVDPGPASARPATVLSCRPWPANFSNFKKPFLLLETSRGCSNRCAFCTSAGEHLRFFPLVRVRNDISIIASAGVKEIRLADRTFNEKPARCLALIKIMRDEFKNIKFHLEIDPARVSDEMIQELSLAEPERFHLEVGIQTTCPEVLRAVGRSGSIERSLSALQQLGQLPNLSIHVDLIAGLPGAVLAGLYTDLAVIALMQPAEIQLELLKVLPGTSLSSDKKKWGIVSAKEPPYEVLQTATMSPDDLGTAQCLSNLIDWFYNAPELQQPLITAVKLMPGFFEHFVDFCGEAANAHHAPRLENRFRLLEQFSRLHLNALIPKLGYAWLKWGLSAQHGICRTTQWKKPLPREASLVEGNGNTAPQRIYLAELERPYFFVYGRYPRRQACAVYVL